MPNERGSPDIPEIPSRLVEQPGLNNSSNNNDPPPPPVVSSQARPRNSSLQNIGPRSSLGAEAQNLATPPMISFVQNDSVVTQPGEAGKREWNRTRWLNFGLLSSAMFLAILAAVLTGVIVFLYSKALLEEAAAAKGRTTLGGAVAQLSGKRLEMELAEAQVTEEATAMFAANPTAAETAPAALRVLNDTLFHQWTSRIHQPGALYGLAIKMLYPRNTTPYVFPQPKASPEITGCFARCLHPKDPPPFTTMAHVATWYDLRQDNNRTYLWINGDYTTNATYTAPDQGGHIYSHGPNEYGISSARITYFNAFSYDYIGAYVNGSYFEGDWRSPEIWTGQDSTSYWYLTYTRMRMIGGTPSVVVVWDTVQSWFNILVSMVPTSGRELMLVTTSDSRRVLAFSQDPYGDSRLRTCQRNVDNLTDYDATRACAEVRAVNHRHSWVRALFASEGGFVASATPAVREKWALVDGARWLLLVVEMWNVDSFKATCTYAVHEEVALKDLGTRSSVVIALATLVVIFSSVILAGVGFAALRSTTATLEIVSQLATHIAEYNIDEAEQVLDNNRQRGNAQMEREFARILRNLRVYRPFLPGTLFAAEMSLSSLSINIAGSGAVSGVGSENGGDASSALFAIARGGRNGEAGANEAGGNENANANESHRSDGAGAIVSPTDVSAPTSVGHSPVRARAPAFNARSAPINHFTLKRFTVAVVVVQPEFFRDATTLRIAEDVEALMLAVTAAATAFGGVVEFMRPDNLLLSFGLHANCNRHERAALRFAAALLASIGGSAIASYVTVVLDTGSWLTGVCGTAELRAPVVFGAALASLQKMSVLALRVLGTQLLITERCASSLADLHLIPIEVVSSELSREPVVLYDADVSASLREDTVAMYKQAFRAMRQRNAPESAALLKTLLQPGVGGAEQSHVLRHHAGRLLALQSSALSPTGLFPPAFTARGEFARPEAMPWLLANPSEEACCGVAPARRAPLIARSTSSLNALVHMSSFSERPSFESLVQKLNAKTEEMRPKLRGGDEDGAGGEPMSLVPMFIQDEDVVVTPVRKQPSSVSNIQPPGALRRVDDGRSPTLARGSPSFPTRATPTPTPATPTTDLPTTLIDVNGDLWIRSQDTIGTGATASVYRGVGPAGNVVALKVIPMRTRDFDAARLIDEVSVLHSCTHEHIVTYHSAALLRNHCVFIMEYLPGGSLKSVLESYRGELPPTFLRRIATEVLRGLAFLHKRGVVHCDIKPHNVLLGSDGVCKITDFGSALAGSAFATRSSSDETSPGGTKPAACERGNSGDMMEIRGTAWYLAPEVAAGNEPAPASDIFSFGVTMVELMTGTLPWDAKWCGDGAVANARFIAALGRFGVPGAAAPELRLEKLKTCAAGPLAAEFVALALVADPAARASAEELLRHPYLL